MPLNFGPASRGATFVIVTLPGFDTTYVYVMVSKGSVAAVLAPLAIVGTPADFATASAAVLLMVAVALAGGEVAVELSGAVPVAVAVLVTAFAIPAALFTSVWDSG